MTVKGTITRLVEPEPAHRQMSPRVFFRPSDPEVYKKLDGSLVCASGEIAVVVEKLEGKKIGDEVELEVG